MEEERPSRTILDYGEGAWIKYILKFNMPSVDDDDKEKEIKKEIINMLQPVMDIAPRGNYENQDIRFALWEYDDYWTSYYMYKRNGRYNADLIQLQRGLRLCFKMELTRGKHMGQMDMIFQPKQSIIQRLISGSRDKTGFFKSKKKETDERSMIEEQ